MTGAGESGKSTVVCVTGASGYIASWLVKLLLHRGYTVKATVRDLLDPKKTEHLVSLEGAKERLHLFEANLLEEGSFDSIINNCHGVFHTASPCFFKSDDPQTQLIEPALKGTINVLTSCAKSHHSIKRVILTSSIAAMLFSGTPRTPQTLVDETWFSDPQICKDNQLWYQLSKTLAEEAAWKFVKEKGIDMVVINPAMVMGPLLQPTLNFSCTPILNLINNSETYPNASFGFVHVNDVVNAHVRAFEIPSANGRYCLTESVFHYSEIVNILSRLYPKLKLPNKCENDEPFAPTYIVSKERARSLGVEFVPFEISLKETVESLIEKKFVTLQFYD
ncbi:phenylacetaldehyde reductase-like [Impatiens glandulifera]|uniref:phenylacetaldehyde reductase-like n=1 Tax=Impatiens glandulifera TaxID=253017 RepID=UPI001FB0B7B0|nr:phenylacetaldehyde reductase-like [Impatiens glandulifera]